MNPRHATPEQLRQLATEETPGTVLSYYGQRRILATRELGHTVYVGQRQPRALAEWQTVITTRDPEHASQWLADATVPRLTPEGQL